MVSNFKIVIESSNYWQQDRVHKCFNPDTDYTDTDYKIVVRLRWGRAPYFDNFYKHVNPQASVIIKVVGYSASRFSLRFS